ncbi:50S ribosomal protein L29, chloroplastic [Cinnamomum micranthum f. kanehirae]|uniref:Large ribosomal subunit protein uL29c n=1 Tax=Cinnamomum micranthum f. kanehirae TaxID=337451 RepID=A0A3S3NGQ4_9MAGN|nr:50S ribosomal protein L29, chloroplastic [Cinnamomum micranthum f. kanehirae]
MKEIRANTTKEINEEIVDLKGELFIIRLQKSQRNEPKSSEFRCMRKRGQTLHSFLALLVTKQLGMFSFTPTDLFFCILTCIEF